MSLQRIEGDMESLLLALGVTEVQHFVPTSDIASRRKKQMKLLDLCLEVLGKLES